MSTGTFSAENTSSIIGPILRFLIPGISEQSLDMIHGLIRKCGHLTEYFILSILLFRAFRSGSMELKTLRWAFFSIIIVIIYAAGDEFHQSFVSTRTASVMDVGIDITGGIFAQGIIFLWYGHKRK